MTSALVMGTTAPDDAVAITLSVTVAAVVSGAVWQVFGIARTRVYRDWDREAGR